jgi:hypothetical protein
MAEDKNRKPAADLPPEEPVVPDQDTAEDARANITTSPTAAPAPVNDMPDEEDGDDAGMAERLERLGGEPAPAISPEEFARLQASGQIHIDARGRVRTTRREKTDAGMSLRKRRAWYGF